jgi:NAD(P)-dependent dehydrogenase (short-subunit alcohol dehydrogenase family)
MSSSPSAASESDRVAVVTGAAQGIGFAASCRLAADGLSVVLADVDGPGASAAARSIGSQARAYALDLTDPAQVDALVADVLAHEGHVDVLVNNAGIAGRTDGGAQDPTTLDLDVVRTVLDTNVFGVVRVTNALLPLLRRAQAPRIVNVSSNMGSLTLRTGPVMAAYAPSKTMLNGITTQYARALADTRVLVNACCPGYVATDFTGHSAPRTPHQGAAIAIRLATLPDDGPRGGFFDDDGVVPW